jgi:hypothetical protein
MDDATERGANKGAVVFAANDATSGGDSEWARISERAAMYHGRATNRGSHGRLLALYTKATGSNPAWSKLAKATPDVYKDPNLLPIR